MIKVFRSILVFCLLSIFSVHHAHAQGSIVPLGAPAPTMKTLDQIEARTPISQTDIPLVINSPGSYYLTTNLTGKVGSVGISIASGDVTLDLNGFTMRGVVGSLEGIDVPNRRYNISIKNGVVREWGRSGVDASRARNSSLDNLKAYTNGWESTLGARGLSIGFNGKIKDCGANNNKSDGIYASSGSIIIHSTARNNENDGITAGNDSTITDSSSNNNGGDGFQISAFSTLGRCTAGFNKGRGVVVSSHCNISESTGSANESDGILAGSGSTISDSTGSINDGSGIVTSDGCTISGSTAFNNDIDGIVSGTGCTIIHSTVRGNDGDGFSLGGACTISYSTAYSNGDDGIRTGTGCAVSHCTALSNTGDGIEIPSRCRVVENNCDSNGVAGDAAGIHATGTESLISENRVGNNDRGIDVGDDRNLIIRNYARDNSGLNYVIVTGNRVGVLVVPPLSGAISGDADPNALGAGVTDPWANFSF